MVAVQPGDVEEAEESQVDEVAQEEGHHGGDEDLIRKNKKKKSLGYIIVRMVLSTLTKEEYNEV